MNARNKLIDKIRKLLALSRSPNENEAMAAAEKVQSLMIEHNLSMSEISDEPVVEDYTIDSLLSEDHKWLRIIGNTSAEMTFCLYLVGRLNGMKEVTHTFFGLEHNIIVAKLMFAYLSFTVDRLAKMAGEHQPKRLREEFMDNFRIACSWRLYERVRQRNAEARRGGMKSITGQKLPALQSLFDSTQAKLKAAAHAAGASTEMVNFTTGGDGLRAGRKAGDLIGLDLQVGSGASATPYLPKAPGRMLTHG